MTVVLYELCAANNLRFSPFCWRTRLALAHKCLDFETVPVKFTQKHKISFSGQDRVPILDDDGVVINDSWAIAKYLEETYPSAPKLFPRARGRHYAKMTNDWADGFINPLILRSIIIDIYSKLDGTDKKYFRSSREKRLGMTLEDVHATREEARQQLRGAMASMRAHLMDAAFVCGDTPAYGDFIVVGSLRWAEKTSEFPLFEDDDPISLWYRRVLERMCIV